MIKSERTKQTFYPQALKREIFTGKHQSYSNSKTMMKYKSLKGWVNSILHNIL
jgi:hypothetical protein